MNFAHDGDFAARPAFPNKTPRKQLMRLEVESDSSGQALLRVLNLIQVQGLVSLAIYARCYEDGQHFMIELDPLPQNRVEALLARIRYIVAVRRVSLSMGAPAEA